MRASIFYNVYAIVVVILECVVLPNSQTSRADEAHVAVEVASTTLPDVALASSAFITNGLIATSTATKLQGAIDSRNATSSDPFSCRHLAELPIAQQRESIILTDLPEIDMFCTLDEETDCADFAKSFQALGVLKNSNDSRYCALIPVVD